LSAAEELKLLRLQIAIWTTRLTNLTQETTINWGTFQQILKEMSASALKAET
jgi:hypothetical protein